MTIGAFVAYVELFGRFVGRGFRIPQLVNSVQSGAAGYARLEPLLGTQLSAGQQQLLALAHALVWNPRLILLDEATSTVDNASDAAFRRALEVLVRERGKALDSRRRPVCRLAGARSIRLGLALRN